MEILFMLKVEYSLGHTYDPSIWRQEDLEFKVSLSHM
jgi:hypothetical protein